MRDFQKNKVYNWEDIEIHSKDQNYVPFDQIQNLVNYVWEQEGLEYPPKVKPLPKQKNCNGDANRLSVRFPEKGSQSTVILHELAHSLTTDFEGLSNAHGGRFIGVYMQLLAKYAGFNLNALMFSAKEHGVEFNFKGKIL